MNIENLIHSKFFSEIIRQLWVKDIFNKNIRNIIAYKLKLARQHSMEEFLKTHLSHFLYCFEIFDPFSTIIWDMKRKLKRNLKNAIFLSLCLIVSKLQLNKEFPRTLIALTIANGSEIIFTTGEFYVKWHNTILRITVKKA